MNTGDILVPERLKPSRVLAKQCENGGNNLPHGRFGVGTNLLSPLESCRGKRMLAGNSARNSAGEGHMDDMASWWRERKEAALRCRKEAAFDASWENLRKAFASPRYHKPRPWRSKEEALMIRRFVLRWWTCRDHNRPSARAWGKQLGVTHVWLLKLVRKFEEDPGEVRQLQAYGDPTLEQLNRAREYTQWMRERGELRNPSPRRRGPPAIPPAIEQFVRERFAQGGWSRSRLARGFSLDRRTVKRILQKV